MGVNILEGNKAKRIAEALETIAASQSLSGESAVDVIKSLIIADRNMLSGLEWGSGTMDGGVGTYRYTPIFEITPNVAHTLWAPKNTAENPTIHLVIYDDTNTARFSTDYDFNTDNDIQVITGRTYYTKAQIGVLPSTASENWYRSIIFGESVNNGAMGEAELRYVRKKLETISADEINDLVTGVVKYTVQELSGPEKIQARTNIGAISAEEVNGLVTGVVKYTEQTLQDEDKAQARANIGAIASADVAPLVTGVVKYTEQTLQEAEKTQARTNIGAASAADLAGMIPNSVSYDSQNLTSEQKAQARTNIGAAFSGDLSDLSGTVSRLNTTVNGIGRYATGVSKTSTGIKVTYSDNSAGEEIDIDTSGIAFDSGYVDAQDYLHLTLGGEELSQSVFVPFQLPAGGGGGGPVSNILLSDVVRVRTVRNGANAIFSFTASTSDGVGVNVEWFVNNVQINNATTSGESGDAFTFNAKNYLNPSTNNTVKVIITSESEATLTRSWPVTTVAYSLSWGNTIDPITLYTANENVFVPVLVSAESDMENDVVLKVGTHTLTERVTGSRSVIFELDSSWFITGRNNITASMTNATDSTDKADDITYVAIWAYGATQPIVAFASATQTGVQYDLIPINYFVYDPTNERPTCTLTIGSENPRDFVADRTMQTYWYMSATIQTITIALASGGRSTTMSLTINQSDYELGYVTGANLRYEINPVGHTNADADRESFANLTFSQGFDWVNGGFKQDSNGASAFVIKKGNSVTLPRSLFADSDANGKTIDISFKIANSDQYDALAIRDLNNGGTRGITLRANEGEIYLNNNNGQIFRYCEENRIDLSILVEAAGNQRISTIWLDGIPSKVYTYNANMLVQSERPMTIGSNVCDVWIYAIRVYNSALTRKEMIQNYIASGSNTDEKIDRYIKNNIFGPQKADETYPVDKTLLHAAMPNLTIITIKAAAMTTGK